MLRVALALAALYLVGYGFAVQRFAWVDWFEPRGGIIGFALYLVLATGLIGYGDRPHRSRSDEIWFSFRSNRRPSTGFQAILAGWILLLMPPLWWIVSASQS